jgi:hypothetical protein
VRADPGLKPAFRAGTPDYAVRCAGHDRVRLAVTPPAGTRVAVGAGRSHADAFDAAVKLVPGRAVRLRFTSHGRGRTYAIRCVPQDFPGWRTAIRGEREAAYYVVTPSRNDHRPRYVIVFDRHGAPVWWMKGDPPPFNAQLLPDGNLAWTRWVFARDPSGFFEEHALDGTLVRTYNTVGIQSNPHELRLLPDGSALLVAYRPRAGVDLSPWGGPPDATVLDGEVQELDPAGNLVWSWSTRDHVALAESARWFPKLLREPVQVDGGHEAYDIVHLNSIERRGDRVVISLRHTDAVYEIDRRSGAIDWKLGGTHTSRSLEIRGDPLGDRDFGGQHDARLIDANTVSLFDNGTLRRDGTVRNRRARVLAFRLDRSARTARLVRSFRRARRGGSTCCGSARRLPKGNWVVSWGNSPYVGELTAAGRPVLTITLGGDLRSYRTFPVLPGELSRAALRRGMDAQAP